MRVGIIDLGTNSVRFDVQQIGPGKKLERLHREKLMVRLGQDVFLNGRLDPEAFKRTLEAFESFRQTSTDLGVNKIIAFGTSALREASDSQDLLDQIKKDTGIEVRVISGEEEALLIARGILSNEKPPKGIFTLVDIGGGSTEISICRGKELIHSHSFGLGTARLQQVFLKTIPPKPAAKGQPNPIDLLHRYIKSVLLPTFFSEDWPKSDRIIGSSGTILALHKVLRNGNGKNGKNSKSSNKDAFDRKELRKLIKTMSTMTTSQLLSLPGLEARRVDMILAGAILLDEVMEALRTKKVFITDYSLRDGILEEETQLFRQNKTSPLAFHLNDLYTKARRLGANEQHFQHVRITAEQLFTRLAKLHKLKPDWKAYLSAAAILHDTGEAISPTDHAFHSYYIVKNAKFPSMEEWECELIAQLCLWHTGGKLSKNPHPLFRGDKPKTQAFLKLLAILRISDALDRSHKALIKIKEIRMDKSEIRIKVSNKTATDLEVLRVEQKKDLFEKVFRRRLVIQRV